MEKKVPDKRLIGTMKKFDTELSISQVKDKNPTTAPIEEKMRMVTVK